MLQLLNVIPTIVCFTLKTTSAGGPHAEWSELQAERQGADISAQLHSAQREAACLVKARQQTEATIASLTEVNPLCEVRNHTMQQPASCIVKQWSFILPYKYCTTHHLMMQVISTIMLVIC